MKTLTITATALVSVVALAIAFAQRRELASLKTEERKQQQQHGAEPVVQAGTDVLTKPPAQYTPSPELLRLRGQVGQLERRKRELAGVPAENKTLRAQLAAKTTNVPGALVLPADYIKKSTARFSGYGTPEDTIQSLLWAVQNQNTTQLLEAFNPDSAKKLEAEIQRRGSPEEFFNDANALPGLRIIGKQTQADGTAVLKVEMLPGTENEARELRFKQFDGQWKLISGF